MQGTIIEIKRDQGYCVVNNPERAETYHATLGELKNDPNLTVGADCEFEISKQPSFFRPGQATLLSCKALDLTNTKVALTTAARYPEHDMIHENFDYQLAAEGGSEREARSALIERSYSTATPPMRPLLRAQPITKSLATSSTSLPN